MKTRLFTFGLLLGTMVSSTGCMMDDDESSSPVNAEAEFLERAEGEWLYNFRIDAADGAVWAQDTVTIGDNRHDITADVYADEARTTRLFRYDAKATLSVVGRAANVPDGYDVDIRLTSATVTAFLDDPALYTAFGLDDCNLVADQAVDVMATNCVYPLGRDTTCTEQDLYQIAAGANEMRIGSLSDRCTTRPTTLDTTRTPYLRR